jgi:hypothetical protein
MSRNQIINSSTENSTQAPAFDHPTLDNTTKESNRYQPILTHSSVDNTSSKIQSTTQTNINRVSGGPLSKSQRRRRNKQKNCIASQNKQASQESTVNQSTQEIATTNSASGSKKQLS